MPPIGITRRGVASGKLPPQAQAILEWAEENDWQTTKDSPGFVADALGDHTGKDTLHTSYDIGSLTRGLVAYYPMDEGQGQVLHDGALSNLGQINGASWNGSGQVGSDALSFDGTDDYVDIDGIQSLNSHTISCWVRVETLDGTNNEFITLFRNNQFRFRVSTSDEWQTYQLSGSSSITISQSATADTWTHLCTNWDGSELRLLVNGSLVGTESISSMDTLGRRDLIGASDDGSGGEHRHFDGQIDHVTIHDRALSQPEIEALANRTAPSGREVTESDVPTQSDNGVSRYEFENDVTDSWGSNDGTDNTSAGFVDGVYGQAKDFDGTDDRVELPDVGLGSSAMTASAWASFDSTGTDAQTILGRYDGTDDILLLNINSSGKIHWRIGHVGGNEVGIIGPVLDAGEWHHAVATWDGGSTTRLYLDGQLVAESTATVADFGTTDGPWVGGRNDDAYYMGGEIDDVRIYSDALSPREVEQLYNKGSWRIERGAVL